MKNLFVILFIVCFFSSFSYVNAQQISPIYDRTESLLTSTDTIPDYRSQKNKLKLTGIIYQSDGVTPAKDVILYIEQPNEDGEFDLRKTGDERYVLHRSWVKTDADGRYTIYTFVPGGDRRLRQLQQIFPLIKAPSQQEYVVDSFLFDQDPLLTKACRKRIAKQGDSSRILKLKSEEGLFVAEKNIILKGTKDLAKL